MSFPAESDEADRIRLTGSPAIFLLVAFEKHPFTPRSPKFGCESSHRVHEKCDTSSGLLSFVFRHLRGKFLGMV